MSRVPLRMTSTRAVGVAAAATLAAGGISAGALGGTAQAAAPRSSAVACAPDSGAQLRVKQGYQGVDRNDLSHATSVRYDNDLKTRTSLLGLQAKATSGRFKTIPVGVHVHVIKRDNGTGVGSPAMVDAQMKVLNEAYSGHTAAQSTHTPFRFYVKSYDVTRNTDWYYLDDDDELPMKQALKKGGKNDLNLYITTLGGGLLGYAYYPQDNAGVLDGVVVLNDSLPGGAAAPYNEGDTLTHEVGHFLGLAHTFENGCQKPGDFVDDTPYQNDGDNIFFCRISDDTCKAKPGKDPVHNFMSYGDDPCLDRFTEGQGYRMLLSWLAYRDQS